MDLEGRQKGGKKRDLVRSAKRVTSEKLGGCNVPEKALEGQHSSLKPGCLTAEHPPCTIPERTPRKPSHHPHTQVFPFHLYSQPTDREGGFLREPFDSSQVVPARVSLLQAALGFMPSHLG